VATHGRGSWYITSGLPAPDMTITKSHTGNFEQGQTGANYTITASNSGLLATTAAVTVTDTLPTGLTPTAISGTGWSCTLATITCTRSDVLAAGASYPAITLTVNVASNAPISVTNAATVSGGGETNAGNDQATDATTIEASGPDMTITKSHTGNFYARETGATYTITASNIGASPTTGTVTVTDTLPTGLTATVMAGTGWICTLATLTCTRSDALASGLSYPPITLTVNVSSSAPSLVTNAATVAGGGETVTSNDTATDSTTILNLATSSISSMFPDTAVAGGPIFTLYVFGSGFVSGAVVNWNGTPLATTYSYAGELYATVPATLIASSGTAAITVSNPSQLPSNAGTFHIVTTSVAPTLTSAGVDFGVWSTGQLAYYYLYVGGSGFEDGMTLSWNNINLGTVYNSYPEVIVPLGLITPGTVSITAANPGSAFSTAQTITIPVLRTLTGISPTSTASDNSTFTLTVNGTGFVRGDYVAVYPGPYIVSTTFVSGTQLQGTVPASAFTASGTSQVFIYSSTSNGAFMSTNQVPLTVGTGGTVLGISKTHTGTFVQGEQNATYTVTVSNASNAAPTNSSVSNQVIILEPDGSTRVANAPTNSPSSGAVTVSDYVPAGMTLVSMAGSGWSCSSGSCNRSDVLAGGASYPPITVTVNVSPTASSPLGNYVSVSGGGGLGDNTTDYTIVGPSGPPSVYIDAPKANAVLSGTAILSGWAIDNTSAVGTSISSVQVSVDGVVVGTPTYGL
jgi:uncharacterized repeat protein (TIGR01451 family)